MEVARLPVGLFEAEPSLPEIDLAGDAGIHHPLQGSIDRRPADAVILRADHVHQFVGGEMSVLPEKHVDDLLALAGALAAGRLQLREIGQGCHGKYWAGPPGPAGTRIRVANDAVAGRPA